MFTRDVLIPDGRVLTSHEVTEIHHLRGESTSINVKSWDNSSSHDWVLQHALDTSLDFADAEEWVMLQPQFAECRDSRSEVISDITALLTDEQAEQVPQAFPEWIARKYYIIGNRVRYNQLLYRCVQAHTSQEGWEPATTPALWVRTAPEGEIPEWIQPTGAHDAYNIGDKVTHNNKTWISTIDANVYEPGVYGWNEVS